MSMNWKNRIVGYDNVDPTQLLANENNWRTHPLFQREVVTGSLDQIGWIQDIIVNIRDSDDWPASERGIQTVLDGHLRVVLALDENEDSVPVKFVNLNPEEEKLALLLLDPSSDLAGADSERLRYLLENVNPIDESTITMLSDLAEKYKLILDDTEKMSDDMFGKEKEKLGFSDFVKFQFGDYGGMVEKDVYERFVSAFERVKAESGEVMLTDVLAKWIGI